MAKKLGGASFSDRQSILVFSHDNGNTWPSVACGNRKLPLGTIDRVKEAARLDPGHKIAVLGSSNVCLEFLPHLGIEAVALAAAALARELQVPEIEYVLLPRQNVGSPSLALIRVSSWPEQG